MDALSSHSLFIYYSLHKPVTVVGLPTDPQKRMHQMKWTNLAVHCIILHMYWKYFYLCNYSKTNLTVSLIKTWPITLKRSYIQNFTWCHICALHVHYNKPVQAYLQQPPAYQNRHFVNNVKWKKLHKISLLVLLVNMPFVVWRHSVRRGRGSTVQKARRKSRFV